MSVSGRRTVPALAAVLALVAGLLATLLVATPSSAATDRTRVVVKVADCEGCQVFVQQGLRNRWWASRTRTVRDGKAVFVVPSSRTRGMSIGITGTWEAASPHPSGFQAIVTLRYKGVAAGSSIDQAGAATKQRGSACFPGTDAHRVVFHVTARKVTIAGNGGPADTTMAWADPQVRTMRSTMMEVFDGVAGAQDIVPCW
ncbi:hypothetical protein ACFFOS_14905 [Nocardioides kongjuensis]|uniref:Uncharacterized protein n=1 Tax=Nocardioides kongjuensis TaxID=349522 RepID=A0A852RV33_9ACTN|nr:hypothetical protein [Nocardioides kongjuensis]NYD30432.1 hypothetical protein [Nocardioides kongjuensis]